MSLLTEDRVHVPFTPWFIGPVLDTAGIYAGASVTGHLQNKIADLKTRELVSVNGDGEQTFRYIHDEMLAFEGFAAYAVDTTHSEDENWDRPYWPDWVLISSETKDGTKTYSWNGDGEVETVTTVDYGPIAGTGYTHTATSTTLLGRWDAEFDPDPSFRVSSSTLSGVMTRADALAAAGDRLAAIIAEYGEDSYFGSGPVYTSESNDSKASVTVGTERPVLPTITIPSSAHKNAWLSGCSGWLGVVTYANKPKAYGEVTVWEGVDSLGDPAGFDDVGSTTDLFWGGVQTTDVSLSDEVTGWWRDISPPYEEFLSVATESLPANALPDCPKVPVLNGSLSDYTNQPGRFQDLTLISRTGRTYRVTLERYTADMMGVITILDEVELVTDPDSLQVVYDPSHEMDASFGMRIMRVEVYSPAQELWVLLADSYVYAQYLLDMIAYDEDYEDWLIGGKVGDKPVKPAVKLDPLTLVSGEITGAAVVLGYERIRRGERFGFPSLNGEGEELNPPPRWRTITVTRHYATTPQEPDTNTWLFGGMIPPGELTFTGTASVTKGSGDLPSVVFSTLSIVSWSEEAMGVSFVVPRRLDSGASALSTWLGDLVTDTATHQVRLANVTDPEDPVVGYHGRSAVRKDVPEVPHAWYEEGDIEWIPFEVIMDGGVYSADAISLPQPAAGYQLHVIGYRMQPAPSE